MPDFIEKMEETRCDIVTGTRYRHKGGVQGWDLKRKLISRVANFIATTTLGVTCTDLTGSFRLYKTGVLKHVIHEVQSKGYAFQPEIVIRGMHYTYTVEEVPIVFVDRIFGDSKIEGAEITKFLKAIWNLFNTF